MREWITTCWCTDQPLDTTLREYLAHSPGRAADGISQSVVSAGRRGELVCPSTFICCAVTSYYTAALQFPDVLRARHTELNPPPAAALFVAVLRCAPHCCCCSYSPSPIPFSGGPVPAMNDKSFAAGGGRRLIQHESRVASCGCQASRSAVTGLEAADRSVVKSWPWAAGWRC